MVHCLLTKMIRELDMKVVFSIIGFLVLSTLPLKAVAQGELKLVAQQECNGDRDCVLENFCSDFKGSREIDCLNFYGVSVATEGKRDLLKERRERVANEAKEEEGSKEDVRQPITPQPTTPQPVQVAEADDDDESSLERKRQERRIEELQRTLERREAELEAQARALAEQQAETLFQQKYNRPMRGEGEVAEKTSDQIRQEVGDATQRIIPPAGVTLQVVESDESFSRTVGDLIGSISRDQGHDTEAFLEDAKGILYGSHQWLEEVVHRNGLATVAGVTSLFMAVKAVKNTVYFSAAILGAGQRLLPLGKDVPKVKTEKASPKKPSVDAEKVEPKMEKGSEETPKKAEQGSEAEGKGKKEAKKANPNAGGVEVTKYQKVGYPERILRRSLGLVKGAIFGVAAIVLAREAVALYKDEETAVVYMNEELVNKLKQEIKILERQIENPSVIYEDVPTSYFPNETEGPPPTVLPSTITVSNGKYAQEVRRLTGRIGKEMDKGFFGYAVDTVLDPADEILDLSYKWLVETGARGFVATGAGVAAFYMGFLAVKSAYQGVIGIVKPKYTSTIIKERNVVYKEGVIGRTLNSIFRRILPGTLIGVGGLILGREALGIYEGEQEHVVFLDEETVKELQDEVRLLREEAQRMRDQQPSQDIFSQEIPQDEEALEEVKTDLEEGINLNPVIATVTSEDSSEGALNAGEAMTLSADEAMTLSAEPVIATVTSEDSSEGAVTLNADEAMTLSAEPVTVSAEPVTVSVDEEALELARPTLNIESSVTFQSSKELNVEEGLMTVEEPQSEESHTEKASEDSVEASEEQAEEVDEKDPKEEVKEEEETEEEDTKEQPTIDVTQILGDLEEEPEQ